MEDSLKGILIATTVILLFTTSILSFIVLFPLEQGISYSDLKSNDTYMAISGYINTTNADAQLVNISNSTDNAFDQWDITQGYMGSNQIKQGVSGGTKAYSKNIFSIIGVIATKLFGSNSPIVYAIATLAILTAGIITYYVIKFVRQGL